MLAIIGGTGFYKVDGLEIIEKREVMTPFGRPSSALTFGRWKGREIVFLPRHGESHALLPSEINYCANIYALKSSGVSQLLSVSAVGSLVQEIAPGDLALPTQYLDWTKGKRSATFFGNGLVAHISTAEPVCPHLNTQLQSSAERLKYTIHNGKTYGCVEGPRLGTRSESFFLKGAGCHLVGMTNVPEVFLAREAQMCYGSIAVATDYDCWHDDPSQHVSLEQVMALYGKTIQRVQNLLAELISNINQTQDATRCECRTSLKRAILTSDEKLTTENKSLLGVLKQ